MPLKIPLVVGENETTISVSVEEKLAGPENPAGYVIDPERSPVPLFEIETATLEVESIPVAMNGMLDEPTVRIG